MKKYIVVLTLLFWSVFTLKAQDSLYNLNDFALPKLLRHSLDNSFYFASNNRGVMNNINSTNRLDLNIDGLLASAYNLNYNDTRWQSKLNASVSFNEVMSGSLYGADNKSMETERFNNYFNSNLRFYTENRYYYHGKFFAEAQFGLETMASFTNLFDKPQLLGGGTQDEKTSINQTLLSPQMYLGGGYGRIERVEDARHAMYILQELTLKKRLSRPFNAADVEQLALRIAELKNERVLDSRLKNIYEMEQLDAFLREHSLVELTDAAYFTTLYDMWQYGGNVIRLSGQRLGAGFRFGFSDRNQHSKIKIDNIITAEDEIDGDENRMEFGLYYQYHFCASEKTQYSLYSQLGYRYGKFETEYNDNQGLEIKAKTLYYNANAVFGYYPNTRTWIEFGIELNGFLGRNDNEQVEVNSSSNSFNLGIGPEVRAAYYFSPHFQLEINLKTMRYYQYAEDRISSDKFIDQFYTDAYLTAGLKYSIF
ncbi:MAG: hypothetical protein Q7J34_04370 [Bacteroidales bacterium]|nr:hypothetical protein [Bacteroidales bacterium]